MGSISKTVTDVAQLNALMGWVGGMVGKALEAGPVEVTLGRPEEIRNSVQNSRYHAMLSDLHKQAVISIPGRRITLSDYDSDTCKALLVMWFARERELNGEPLARPPRSITDPMSGEQITIRPSTTKWSKRDASDFVEFLYSLGADCKVVWGDPALKQYQEYRQAQQ